MHRTLLRFACAIIVVGIALNARDAAFGDSDSSLPSCLSETRKAFLGVVSTPREGGALVVRVEPGSPASTIGLMPGDLLLSVDGFQLGVINGATYSLPSEMRRAGHEISLRFRGQSGQIINRRIAVGGRCRNQGRSDAVPVLGVSSTLGDSGETVESVTPGTPAAEAHLRPNDVVLAVDGYRLGRIENNAYSLASEIRHAGVRTTLTVLRAFDGSTAQVRVQLADVPIPVTRRVHALLIGLTKDPSIGAAARNNLNGVKAVLQDIPSDRRGTIREVSGNECSAEGITSAIAALDVGEEDALLVYVSAHGAYNPQLAPAEDSSGGHLIEFRADDPQDSLSRFSLINELKKKKPRLTILLTDTCNRLSSGALSAPAPFWPGEPLVVTLLFRYHGFVDVNGAARGQVGWYNVVNGETFGNAGIFTMATGFAFHEPESTWPGLMNAAERNAGGQLEGLRRYFEQHRDSISDADYQVLVGQHRQTPQVFELDLVRD